MTAAPPYACECTNEDGTAPERALYVVTNHEGDESLCLYCSSCAELAGVDYNGETAKIERAEAHVEGRMAAVFDALIAPFMPVGPTDAEIDRFREQLRAAVERGPVIEIPFEVGTTPVSLRAAFDEVATDLRAALEPLQLTEREREHVRLVAESQRAPVLSAGLPPGLLKAPGPPTLEIQDVSARADGAGYDVKYTLKVPAIMVDTATEPRFAPHHRYLRADLARLPGVLPAPIHAEVGIEWVDLGDGPERFLVTDRACCREEPGVAWGLGAPCGGFASYAVCFGECGRYVWFEPSPDSDDE